MLGGYEALSPSDALGSLKFLEEFVTGAPPRIQHRRVLGTPPTAMFAPWLCGPDSSRAASAVADCGAGIGRVSREVLLRVFNRGDLVEVNPKFVEQAKRCVGTTRARTLLGLWLGSTWENACVGGRSRDLTDGRLERFICSGLQDFTPEAGRYDAIWSQWVLGHLHDGTSQKTRLFLNLWRGLRQNTRAALGLGRQPTL